MARKHIDLIRVFTEDPLFYSLPPALLTRKPLLYYNGGRTFPEKKRRVLLERFCANLATAVVVPSKELANYMTTKIGISSRKLRVIPNGVDTSRFDLPLDLGMKRHRLGIPANDLVVGTIGRLEPQKDYETFLRISRTVLNNRKDFTFLIVGDGSLKSHLTEMSQRYDVTQKVKFLGLREDVAELFQIIDIFVLTARWEGMSNSVLEAMASKTPVIATDVEGMAGMIDHGINGFILPVAAADAFASTLLSLTREQMANLGENAYKTVKDKFSVQRMVARYESLYRELL